MSAPCAPQHRSLLRLGLLTVVLTLSLGAGTARAEEAGHGGGGHEQHFFAGVKGAYLAGIHGGEVEHLGGGGGFFELTVVPSWLEVELSVKVLRASHATVLPIDLLLKVPFHLSPKVAPFVGVGPAVAVAIGGDSTSAHYGAASAAGAYFWLWPSVALSVEADYNLLYDHGAVHEVGGSAGVVYGW